MHTIYRFAGINRALEALADLSRGRFQALPHPTDIAKTIGRLVVAGMRWVAAYSTPKCDRLDRRIIEMVLVFQAACFVLLGLVAPFDGFGLPPEIALFLLVQAGWVVLVLEAVRDGRTFLATCAYVPLVGVTFVEALRFGGFAGLVFAAEAGLSVIAVYFLATLPGRLARRAKTQDVTKGSA
ncbi:MAG: hypothetical protein AAFW01_06990 [Pseudomonadota bacterium]